MIDFKAVIMYFMSATLLLDCFQILIASMHLQFLTLSI